LGTLEGQDRASSTASGCCSGLRDQMYSPVGWFDFNFKISKIL